jgi:hypothetical protein
MAVRAVQHDPSDDPGHQGWPSVGKGRESLPTTGVRTCVSLFLLVGLLVWRWWIGVVAVVQSTTVTVPEKWGSGSVGQVAVDWGMGLGPCFPALVQSAAVAVPEKWDGEQMAEVCGTGFGSCLSAVPGKRAIEADKSVAIKAEHEYEYFPFALFLSLCVLFSFSLILFHHDVVDVCDLMTMLCKMGRSLTSTKKPDELMCLSCSLVLCSLKSTSLCLGCFAVSVLFFCFASLLFLSRCFWELSSRFFFFFSFSFFLTNILSTSANVCVQSEVPHDRLYAGLKEMSGSSSSSLSIESDSGDNYHNLSVHDRVDFIDLKTTSEMSWSSTSKTSHNSVISCSFVSNFFEVSTPSW